MSDENRGCNPLFLMGAIFGALLSYALNGSILWAILHWFIWWAYIPYAIIFRAQDVAKLFQ